MVVQSAVWCCTSCGAVYHKDFPRCPNDGAEVQLAQRDPLLDQSIGHYVIDRLVGEGGMGRVYAAHHATLPAKRYAIKVLLGDVAATSSMRRRFAKEAESASKLDHPNIVHVQDFGEMASGLPYIVMDYIDGVSLTTLFEGCAMEPARVIRIARAVCEGLAYAHDAGVVHRDLKPDNIIVVISSDGSEVPRIADFGLATTVDPNGTSRITTTGMAMGTPAYAAPEQMAGKRVDGRADLYSLGMSMFEMLTGGQLPFEGHPMEMMTAKAHREAPRLSEIAPNVVAPPGLEDLIAQLIRRKYIDRPATARDVIAALDRIAGRGIADGFRAAAFARSGDPKHRAAQQVAVTLGVRRKSRTWPWLMAAGLASGGVLGWGYHRRDALRQFIALDEPAASVVVQEPSAANVAVPAAVTPPGPAPVAPPANPPSTTADNVNTADPPSTTADNVDTSAIEVDPSAADPDAVSGADVAFVRASPQSTKSHTRKERRVSVQDKRDDIQAAANDRRPSKQVEIAAAESPPVPPVGSSTRPSADTDGSHLQPSAAASGSASGGAPGVAPPTAAAASAPPRVLVPEIATLDVTGALSRSSVRHAVERVMPAIHRCVPAAPRTVKSHFTIDESRRAQNVRGTSDCVVAALGGIRMDTAPDVGDAEVEVQIRFAPKP